MFFVSLRHWAMPTIFSHLHQFVSLEPDAPILSSLIISSLTIFLLITTHELFSHLINERVYTNTNTQLTLPLNFPPFLRIPNTRNLIIECLDNLNPSPTNRKTITITYDLNFPGSIRLDQLLLLQRFPDHCTQIINYPLTIRIKWRNYQATVLSMQCSILSSFDKSKLVQ